MGQKLLIFLSAVSQGVLEKWSLVIYGTAEQPYPAHRERARSAEIPADSDLSEEYSGESYTLRLDSIKLPLVLSPSSQSAA